MKENNKFPVVLFCIYVVLWVVFALNPVHRGVWILENIVVLIFLPLFIISYFKFRLTNTSYFLIFLFGVMHIFGSYYTYSGIPFGEWLSQIFNFERNNYDRIVHFSFGFLTVSVLWDLIYRFLPKNKFFAFLFVVSIIVFLGSVYEIGEFTAGTLAVPEMGMSFLALQGDVWDTQKDMALQTIGAILGLLVFPLRNKNRSVPK